MSIAWTDDLSRVDWEEASELYRVAPLGTKSAEHLRVVFTNSMFRCFAFEEGKLVAAGRCLSDGRDCAYLADVAVLPSHQGKGLGGHIIRTLMDRVKDHRKIILYAVPGKEPIYARFGFRRMTTAMAVFSDEGQTRIYTTDV